MKTPTVALTLFALAALAAGMMPLPAIGQTAAPGQIRITGHHDNHTRGAGYSLSHGSLTIADGGAHPSLSDATFNSNVIGLSISQSTACIYGGQFSHNSEDGLEADGLGTDYGSAITVSGGQFSSNQQDGLCLQSSSATVTEGQFTGNGGPGLLSDQNSTVHVSGGQFTENGYGLEAGHFSCISVTGGLFSGNTQADLWANDGTIILLGAFRQNGAACSGTLTGSGALDVLFPGTTQWQTIRYKTTNGGEIVLAE